MQITVVLINDFFFFRFGANNSFWSALLAFSLQKKRQILHFLCLPSFLRFTRNDLEFRAAIITRNTSVFLNYSVRAERDMLHG